MQGPYFDVHSTVHVLFTQKVSAQKKSVFAVKRHLLTEKHLDNTCLWSNDVD